MWSCDPDLICRSGFFVDGDAPQRDEVCVAVAALKKAAEQFGEGILLLQLEEIADSRRGVAPASPALLPHVSGR